MKNPLKQMQRVQKAMVAQAYQAYLYGHKEGKENKGLLSLKEFCNKIQEIVK